jgi:hypothetical protein
LHQGRVNRGRQGRRPPNRDNRLGLKRRAFDDLLVVGSKAVATRVATARKLHGRGRFGGHNLFFNQEIRAELTFAGPSGPIALDEVKRHVLRAFEEWEGWSTRGDWDSLPGRIERAGSVHQIIRILGP